MTQWLNFKDGSDTNVLTNTAKQFNEQKSSTMRNGQTIADSVSAVSLEMTEKLRLILIVTTRKNFYKCCIKDKEVCHSRSSKTLLTRLNQSSIRIILNRMIKLWILTLFKTERTLICSWRTIISQILSKQPSRENSERRQTMCINRIKKWLNWSDLTSILQQDINLWLPEAWGYKDLLLF